jgi:threonine dehydratase
MGVPCRVLVPDNAPATKVEAVKRLGGEVMRAPFDAWWRALVERRYPGLEGAFVHPVSDPRVVAGNGTIGIEILEDLPDVDTLLVPFGGGGLIGGIASAAKALKPAIRVLACEVETAAPLTASFAAGRPVQVERTPSFVDGIGGNGVLEDMWPLVREVVDGTVVVSLDETARAMRVLAERLRVIAEGAGAAPVAAALSGCAGAGRLACVVSGGNIDLAVYTTLLQG